MLGLFCYVVLGILSIFANILIGEDKAGHLTLIVFLIFCSVDVPHSTVVWYAVCDCSMS